MTLGYYLTENLKSKPQTDTSGRVVLDFGRNKPDEVKELQLFVRNEGKYIMELNPYSDDEDLVITKYPRILQPNEVGEVKLTFTPKAGRIIPLRSQWGFELTIG